MADWTNLITSPNDISHTSWTANAVTVLWTCPDQVIKDVAGAAEESPSVSCSVACCGGSTLTFYMRARAGTLAWTQVSFGNSDDSARAWFDLSRGVVGQQINCVASIWQADHGVWECCLRGKTSGDGETSDIIIGPSVADGSFSYHAIGCGSVEVREVRAYLA